MADVALTDGPVTYTLHELREWKRCLDSVFHDHDGYWTQAITVTRTGWTTRFRIPTTSAHEDNANRFSTPAAITAPWVLSQLVDQLVDLMTTQETTP